jgi:hypothetical protein
VRTSLAQDFVTIKGRAGAESEKAIQFTVHEVNGVDVDEETTEWFPLSQTSSITRSGSAELDTIKVSNWIASKKGLV